jgi:hypothetical protein
VQTRDQRTIDRWRTEPPLRMLDIDGQDADHNPPLWKDLAFASIVALPLWLTAAAVLA